MALALLGTACAAGGDAPAVEDPPLPPADTVPAVPAPPPVPGADRPDTVAGILNLEGSREPMTYRIYRSPETFPIPFSTYVPADMEAAEAEEEGASAVRFVAAFGGRRNEGMYVSARFPDAELSTEEARDRARSLAEAMGSAERDAEVRYPWALESYRVRGEGGRVGSVALGRHGARYFFVLTEYPAEAGDGFGPRVRRVLDEWRWAEGGGLGT